MYHLRNCKYQRQYEGHFQEDVQCTQIFSFNEKKHGGFASLIVIIRTTLIALTILVVVHVGVDFIGATRLKDCSKLRNRDFDLTIF